MGMDPVTGMVVGKAVTGGSNILGNMLAQRRQHKFNKELQAIQYSNQRLLNEQGHELQKEMWEHTNYPNQVKMLEEAGLNPALVYGKSGGGGTTTGSQGGGSAASGSAGLPNFNIGMDIANAIREASQVKLNKAQANKLDAEAERIRGVDTELGYARITDLQAGIENKKAQTELINADINVRKATEEFTYQQIDESHARMVNTIIETERSIIQLGVDKETAETKIKLLQQEWQLGEMEKALKEAGIEKTHAEIKEIHDKISREWAKLGLDKERIDLEKDKNKISEFEAETKRAYPSIMNALGHQIQGGLNKLGWLFGSRVDAEYDHVKGTDKTHEKHKTIK